MAATAVGAAGVLAFKRVNSELWTAVVAFCAGMMAFSTLEMINESHTLSGHRVAFASFLVGMAVFSVLDKLLPHAHMALLGTEMPDAKRKVALLVGTITVHNIPEGFAIASAFASSSGLGWLVAMSIALQDIPEGLIVAAPVACYGVALHRAFLWGVFSGWVEFAAAIGGFLLLRAVSGATPLALGFSAGAMTYVIFFELLPDAMREGNRREALAVFIAGVALAYWFSTRLGF